MLNQSNITCLSGHGGQPMTRSCCNAFSLPASYFTCWIPREVFRMKGQLSYSLEEIGGRIINICFNSFQLMFHHSSVHQRALLGCAFLQLLLLHGNIILSSLLPQARLCTAAAGLHRTRDMVPCQHVKPALLCHVGSHLGVSSCMSCLAARKHV